MDNTIHNFFCYFYTDLYILLNQNNYFLFINTIINMYKCILTNIGKIHKNYLYKYLTILFRTIYLYIFNLSQWRQLKVNHYFYQKWQDQKWVHTFALRPTVYHHRLAKDWCFTFIVSIHSYELFIMIFYYIIHKDTAEKIFFYGM